MLLQELWDKFNLKKRGDPDQVQIIKMLFYIIDSLT